MGRRIELPPVEREIRVEGLNWPQPLEGSSEGLYKPHSQVEPFGVELGV